METELESSEQTFDAISLQHARFDVKIVWLKIYMYCKEYSTPSYC